MCIRDRYYIVDELEKRGMPMELALLPMVESAYNPMALSLIHIFVKALAHRTLKPLI